jgi:hypothetical protein
MCHQNGGCQVTVENRQKCKKCRYDKCIKSGMKPDAILSEDQKEIRFRKILSKKRNLAEQQNIGQEQVPATNPQADATVFQLSRNPVLFNPDQGTIVHSDSINLGPESHSTVILIPDNQIFLTTSFEEPKRQRTINYLISNSMPNLSCESSSSLPSSSGLSLPQLPHHLVPANSFVVQPQGFNFINILRTNFLYEHCLSMYM